MAAIASRRHVVVMLPFVRGDHRLDVHGGSLDVLPHWASHVRALVVAPGFATQDIVSARGASKP